MEFSLTSEQAERQRGIRERAARPLNDELEERDRTGPFHRDGWRADSLRELAAQLAPATESRANPER